MVYSTIDYFIENFGSEIPEEQIEKKLKQASREIDKYLIIKPTSMNELSDYEKEIFNSCCCELAIFLQKNSKYINAIVKNNTAKGAIHK